MAEYRHRQHCQALALALDDLLKPFSVCSSKICESPKLAIVVYFLSKGSSPSLSQAASFLEPANVALTARLFE
jgi:hypothetical protein